MNYSDGTVVYGTQLIDLENFKGTTFVAPIGVEIFGSEVIAGPSMQLKIVAYLEPTDPTHDQTPIVHSYTYQLDKDAFTFDGGSINGALILPITNCYQASGCYALEKIVTNETNGAVFGADVETSGSVIIDHDISGSRTYTATNSIVLKPGFHVKSGIRGRFTAEIEEPAPSLNLLKVNEYFAGCNQFPNGRTEGGAQIYDEPFDSDEELNYENLTLKLSPNPTTSRLDVFVGNGQQNSTVTILSLNGSVIDQVQFSGFSYILDVSQYQSGVYFIHLQNGQEKVVEKFIKK